MKNKTKFAALLITAFAIFTALRQFGFDLSLCQTVAFPLVAFSVAQLRLWGKKMPNPVLFCGVAAGLLGAASINLYTPNIGNGIYVSLLTNDDTGSESRTFRAQINKHLSYTGNYIARRYPEIISSHKTAKEMVSLSQEKAVIWGNTDQINVALKAVSPIPLAKMAPRWDGIPGRDLAFITQVPFFSLSYTPRSATARFIAYTLGAILERRQNLKLAYLGEASTTVGWWKKRHHKAYVLWQIGNMHFVDAVDSAEYEPSEIRCAIASYRKALNFIDEVRQNPDLYTAIHNNYALALYLKYELEGDKSAKEKIESELTRAKKYGKSASVGTARGADLWKTAKANIQKLYKIGLIAIPKLERKENKRRKKNAS
ncbi:MAG: hypothetical protein D6808_00395 [Candidatus Dadabacteria bacterium]|nr:MAG: hypothetical protein D6808_00395 [Candidatus Dadabacteria bacterium]